MKVVFLQDVPDVAKAGDVKEVADGYARNYLIPRKLATLASPHAISRVETSDKIAAKTLDELAELADKLDGKEVSLKAHAGAKDRLYGSITSADIAAELERATGIAVDKRKIELDKPIHQLGDYELTIKLGKDIAPKIKVSVIEEEAPPEEEKPKKAKKAAKKTAKAEEKPKAKKTTKKKEETAEKETKAPKAEKKAKTTKKATKKATEAEKEKKTAKKKETAAKKTTKKTTKTTKKKEEKA